MSTFNIDTFNDILLKAAKDEKSKIKIIEVELGMTASIYMDQVALLLDELEENGYKSEQFQKIQNIKNNFERLIEMFEELQGNAERSEE